MTIDYTTDQLDIGDIVTQLNTVSAITDITGTRIYYGPPNQEQSGIYLILEGVSETQDYTVKGVTIQFRAVGHDSNVTFKQLQDLRKEVVNYCYNNTNYNGQFVYYRWETTDRAELIDEKNRKELVFGMMFYILR